MNPRQHPSWHAATVTDIKFSIQRNLNSVQTKLQQEAAQVWKIQGVLESHLCSYSDNEKKNPTCDPVLSGSQWWKRENLFLTWCIMAVWAGGGGGGGFTAVGPLNVGFWQGDEHLTEVKVTISHLKETKSICCVHLLIWRGWGLRPVLGPTTRGWSRCFGFSFRQNEHRAASKKTWHERLRRKLLKKMFTDVMN